MFGAKVVVDDTIAQRYDECVTGIIIVRRPNVVISPQMALQCRPKGRKFIVAVIIATIPAVYKV